MLYKFAPFALIQAEMSRINRAEKRNGALLCRKYDRMLALVRVGRIDI
jgi:hypothetical protein